MQGQGLPLGGEESFTLMMFANVDPFLFSENASSLSFPIQPSNIEGAPFCFYPNDYGYTVTTSSETAVGMTLDITRNRRYRSSGRPQSRDIDNLRVEIHYHTSDMLQFKVCVHLLFCAFIHVHPASLLVFRSLLWVLFFVPKQLSGLPALHKR